MHNPWSRSAMSVIMAVKEQSHKMDIFLKAYQTETVTSGCALIDVAIIYKGRYQPGVKLSAWTLDSEVVP